MYAPYRKPWLGDRWIETGLLVLGESHYSNENPEDPEMTRKVVSDVAAGRRKLRFFTAVERVITGCAAGETRPPTFWPNVAFANFCPGAVADRSQAVTPEMMDRGIRAFPGMLGALRPRRVLFVTKRCWKAAERFEGVTWIEAEPLLHEGHGEDVGFFGLADFQPGALAMSIQHPATPGWDLGRWHALVRDFLARPLVQA